MILNKREKKKQQKMAGRKMVMVTHLLLSSKLLIHFQRHDVNDFSIRDFKLFSACCFSPSLLLQSGLFTLFVTNIFKLPINL